MSHRIASFLTLAALAATAPDADAFLLRGSVLGGGGSTTSNSSFRVQGTVGQPIVGMSEGVAFDVCSGFWCAGGVRVVAVEDPPPGGLPARLELGPPVPNPARGAIAFTLALPRAVGIRLALYDVRGRDVQTLVQGRMDPGSYHLQWGSTSPGASLPESGVYFAMLYVDGALAARRRVVLLH